MNKDNKVLVKETQAVLYNGPLPTSNEFAGYEKAFPGAAERILAMAEKEALHRQEMEKDTNKKIYSINSWGQRFGFCSIILCIGAIVLSIVFNQPFSAIVPAIISLGGLIAVYSGKK